MKFSQRYGYVPVRPALQTGDIDDGLRNRLWNLVRSTFFRTVPSWHGASGDYLPGSATETFLQEIWHDYLKLTVEGIGRSYFDAVKNLKEYFTQCRWHEVCDFVEYLAANPISLQKQGFIKAVNEVLKEESSGYRFVSGHIVEITSEEEIKSIEQALALPDSLKPSRDYPSGVTFGTKIS